MMKKKILALILSLVMCFSVPATVTASALTLPDMGDLISAVSTDTKNAVGAFLPLAKLSFALMGKMGPYLKNVVFTEDNMETVQDLSEKLMAKVMTKIQSSVDGTINNIKDSIASIFEKPMQPAEPTTKPVTPTEPTDPTTPTQPTEPTTEPTTELTTEPDDDEVPGFEVKAGDLSEILSKYIFVKFDDSPEIARIIASDSAITYHTINGDDGTLYISINIEENPQIFNYAVFRQVVEDLYARQGEELLTDKYGKIDYAMSYEHIAGELAMHMLLFAAVSEVMHVTKSRDKRLVDLYKSCAVADLNIDEARIPTEAISILGILLINFVRFNTYKLLGII